MEIDNVYSLCVATLTMGEYVIMTVTFYELSNRSSILGALDDELRLRGFTGPTDVPKLVFLCLYTRFFGKPVSLVIKGPSGSGKSYALRAGLQFIPSDAFEEFSGLSEKALLYMGELNLKHRHLVIGEAAGLADGNGRAFLRQLLSEGHLRYVTVQSTSKDGLQAKELDSVEGPTGLIMTTTANALHLEDESRMLSYHMDESPERIMEALVKQAEGFQTEQRPLDTDPWFALHDMVGKGDLSVEVPYAKELAKKLPVSHFRVMRDFPQVLALIRAHALLHQCTRQRDETGRVLATLDDYRAIHDLVAEPLAQGLEEAVPEQIRIVVEKVKELQGKTKSTSAPFWAEDGVSQVQLADALGRDQSVVSRHVRKAVGQGFLKDLTPGQGKKATLVVGDRQLPSGLCCHLPKS